MKISWNRSIFIGCVRIKKMLRFIEIKQKKVHLGVNLIGKKSIAARHKLYTEQPIRILHQWKIYLKCIRFFLNDALQTNQRWPNHFAFISINIWTHKNKIQHRDGKEYTRKWNEDVHEWAVRTKRNYFIYKRKWLINHNV